MSWFEARVISHIANKASLFVFAAAIWVVAERSRGELAAVFEEWEVVSDGASELNGEAF